MNAEYRRRATDKLAMFAVVLAAAGIFLSVWLYARIQSEGKARRSQTCETFEGAHKQEIDKVNQTYKYLLAVPRGEWDETHRFVFQTLPPLEAAARSDQDRVGQFVPRYCDVNGVGLNEPDPRVPRRPKSLK